jgi:hypothetical protein
MRSKSPKKKNLRKNRVRKKKSTKRGGGLGNGIYDHESLSMTPEQVAAVTAETHYGRTCKIHPKKGDRYAVYEADGSLSKGYESYGGEFEKEDVFKFKHFPSPQHALAKCNKAIKSDKLCKHRDGSADRPWKTSSKYIPLEALGEYGDKKFKSFRKCYNKVIPHSKGRVDALPEDKRYCFQSKNKFGELRWYDNLVGSPENSKVRPRATKRSKSKEECEEKLRSMNKLAGPDYVYNMPKIEKDVVAPAPPVPPAPPVVATEGGSKRKKSKKGGSRKKKSPKRKKSPKKGGSRKKKSPKRKKSPKKGGSRKKKSPKKKNRT